MVQTMHLTVYPQTDTLVANRPTAFKQELQDKIQQVDSNKR